MKRFLILALLVLSTQAKSNPEYDVITLKLGQTLAGSILGTPVYCYGPGYYISEDGRTVVQFQYSVHNLFGTIVLGSNRSVVIGSTTVVCTDQYTDS